MSIAAAFYSPKLNFTVASGYTDAGDRYQGEKMEVKKYGKMTDVNRGMLFNSWTSGSEAWMILNGFFFGGRLNGTFTLGTLFFTTENGICMQSLPTFLGDRTWSNKHAKTDGLFEGVPLHMGSTVTPLIHFFWILSSWRSSWIWHDLTLLTLIDSPIFSGEWSTQILSSSHVIAASNRQVWAWATRPAWPKGMISTCLDLRRWCCSP